MVSETQIQEVLKNYSLGDLKYFVRLKHGFANENYKIITSKGNYLFRLCHLLSFEETEKEHKMLAVLKQHHFPAAYPVADKKGNTLHTTGEKPVAIYDFVEGDIPEINPATVAAIASALALLHTIPTKEIPPKKNIIRPESIEILIGEFPDAPHPIPDIFTRFELYWNELKPFLRQDLPSGLIHGDVFPDNTLFNGNRLMAVIDFEEYCFDTFLFDIAMCINGFCFKNNRLDKNLLQNFITAYSQTRPLNSTEKTLLPYFIRWTALGIAGWHLQHHLIYKAYERQEKRVRELIERVTWLRNELIT